MGEEHSPATTNPQRIMFFPYSTNHQLIVDMANSLKETIRLTENQRQAYLHELQAVRVHELMHFRPHTVDTDGF
jgi:hypothetical protein